MPAATPNTGSAFLPQPRVAGTGAPAHSSLIPGSPTLPLFGNQAGAPSSPSSLLSREIPAAAPVQSPEAPSELSPAAPRPMRPIKKPNRSSNIFMFALAVIFLAGFLAAAGWMFREPLMEVVNRYMPPDDDAAMTELPEGAITPDSLPAQFTEPNVTETKPKAVFDPEETAPPRAIVPTPEDMAALQSVPTPETPAGGLMEVPSKPMAHGLQNDTSPDTTSSVVMPAASEVKIEVSEEGRPAADALLKFLNAKDLQERLKYTLAASSMKPLMERYYQTQADGPIRIDAAGLVRLDPKPQMGGGAHAVFGVESRAWEYPVPVMLEEGRDGWQVDWLSFVEFKDRILEKFFEEYQEGAARFHVGITRMHYFEGKVPNSDNKDAFRIGPAPPNPFLTTVFVEKDSQVGRDLKERIPWGAQVWAIVELEWVKLGSQQWVQLVGVPQLNWYSVPPEPKGKSGKSSDLPNEIQRAVPVGR
ncbi:hypothetical protein WJU23_08315 [Prosthecobacter sp. SYSU 5D2]|uniref:hypothetical protein n=1 Tax=Prosthecobacter sp. SYSU 5D2 TaxID=3134134 RepID=UPI0031FF35C9